MKITHSKIIIILIMLIGCVSEVVAAPGPPPPSTPPPPPGLPIDGYLYILAIVSLIFALYKTYKIKKASN
jgi:hypothetical protein